jgi:hypothetical protein
MSTGREAGEVVGARMDLLHERSLGVDHAFVLENTMNLSDDLRRSQHVLKDGLHDDCVDTAGGHWDGVRVGYQLRDIAPVEVEPDHLDVIAGGVEAIETVPDSPTADHKYPDRPVRQEIQHPSDAVISDPVERLPDGS